VNLGNPGENCFKEGHRLPSLIYGTAHPHYTPVASLRSSQNFVYGIEQYRCDDNIKMDLRR
jgi:hypothetical protein